MPLAASETFDFHGIQQKDILLFYIIRRPELRQPWAYFHEWLSNACSCNLQCISQDGVEYDAIMNPNSGGFKKKKYIFTHATCPQWGTIYVVCGALLTVVT